MGFNEEIEEDSILFDIVDSIDFGDEETGLTEHIEELDFEKAELDNYNKMLEDPDNESDILE